MTSLSARRVDSDALGFVLSFHMTMAPEPEPSDTPGPIDLVKGFLRGQNLEQVGRIDEAVALYEEAVAARFDSSGPYDRLIQIYADRAMHADVARVAEAALASVRTYEDKRGSYEAMRAAALKAAGGVPPAAPRR